MQCSLYILCNVHEQASVNELKIKCMSYTLSSTRLENCIIIMIIQFSTFLCNLKQSTFVLAISTLLSMALKTKCTCTILVC